MSWRQGTTPPGRTSWLQRCSARQTRCSPHGTARPEPVGGREGGAQGSAIECGCSSQEFDTTAACTHAWLATIPRCRCRVQVSSAPGAACSMLYQPKYPHRTSSAPAHYSSLATTHAGSHRHSHRCLSGAQLYKHHPITSPPHPPDHHLPGKTPPRWPASPPSSATRRRPRWWSRRTAPPSQTGAPCQGGRRGAR
jgi:hypothetical protein